MLQVIYEGAHRWHLRFDSGAEIILDTKELEELQEIIPHVLYEEKTTDKGLHHEAKAIQEQAKS